MASLGDQFRNSALAELTPGIYEQFVTNELQSGLAAIHAARDDRDPLDPVDAHEVLTRHLATLVRRALRSVAGDDAVALTQLVARANPDRGDDYHGRTRCHKP